jgi:hypothetical protein
MAKYSGSGWHFQSGRHSNAKRYGHAGGYYAIMKNSDMSAKIIRTNKTPMRKDFPDYSYAEGKYKTKKEAINRANALGYKPTKHYGKSNPLSQKNIIKKTQKWKSSAKKLASRHFGMANNTLAKKFSEGDKTGKGNNMFIEGNTIYSYGRHFPIAHRLPSGLYLINKDKYSVSTGKHQSYVKRNIPEKDMIMADTKEINEAIQGEQ